MSSLSFVIQKPIQTVIYATVGIALRLLITNEFNDHLEQRVEITTPINSWKRAQEAVHLWDSGLNPYLGNIFHEFPLFILFYKFIQQYLNSVLIFALVDCLTGILLSESIYRHAINQNSVSKQHPDNPEKKAKLVLLTYLYSPLAIAACAGHATTIFTNFLIATILLTTSLKFPKSIVLPLCALLSCNNIHYATLTIPIALIIEYISSCVSNQKQDSNPEPSHDKDENLKTSTDNYHKSPLFHQNLSNTLTIWTMSIVAIMLSCYFLMNNSWTFLKSSHLFTLQQQDLSPNIGMFWYFFTEVFEHYLSFFTWVIQINAFIHALPLCVTFKDDPYFAHYIVLLTSTIFQPYPSLGNIAILFSLTFEWLDLFVYLKRSLVVICALISSMCLWPVFWHLWIIMGTANANFYFGATLAFMTAIVLFMIDLFNAKSLYSETKLKIFDKDK